MTLILTSDQTKALDLITEFLKDNDKNVFTLSGRGGTGKTKMIQYLTHYITNSNLGTICAVAPTHKAKRILSAFINEGLRNKIDVFTVASILSKFRKHSYIGTKNFSAGKADKLGDYSIIILDEVSMVADPDLTIIINYANENFKKLILIGDQCQIPAPSQKVVIIDNKLIKPDSFAFNLPNKFHMTEIVRQQANSPIIKVAGDIRDNLESDVDLNKFSDMLLQKDQVYSKFATALENGKIAKIITYTNASVHRHNTEIRKCLGHADKFVIGDILTAYTNVGYPVVQIENGSDYKVTDIKLINNFKIGTFKNLIGYLLKLRPIHQIGVRDESREVELFFILPLENPIFMNELTERAIKVNQKNSKPAHFKDYSALKNNAVFIDNIYKLQDHIYNEYEFKYKHALLFTKVSDVIHKNEIIDQEMAARIESSYGSIVKERLGDNKTISDSETFADKYCIIEKDMDYGFASSAHKSQGSTFQVVFVDYADFDRIGHFFNQKFKMYEDRTREKNQLLYVACTRASEDLYLIN